jgi:hypothetical protein
MQKRKKAKKDTKIRDLKPKKDVKGGLIGLLGPDSPKGNPRPAPDGYVPSSKRFKTEVHNMDKTSEAILALKPVTFRYKKELDPEGIPQFGLVAEEVEKVNPDLITRDREGKPDGVRYDAVNAMLLNEFIKAHRKIKEQSKRIEELTARVDGLH